MSSGPISDAWFHRVKAATRDLVKLCGGVARAGEIAAASTSAISRWQHAGQEDIIPIAAVLALETDCGVPCVTSAMAGLQGRSLTDPDAEGEAGDTATLARLGAEVAQAHANMMIVSAQAHADGIVTPAEAEQIDRAAAEAEVALAAKRRALAGKKAGLRAVK